MSRKDARAHLINIFPRLSSAATSPLINTIIQADERVIGRTKTFGRIRFEIEMEEGVLGSFGFPIRRCEIMIMSFETGERAKPYNRTWCEIIASCSELYRSIRSWRNYFVSNEKVNQNIVKTDLPSS